MVTRATMHHIVAGLERDGYISRKPDMSDARSQSIELTRQGTAVITKAHSARIDFYRSVLEGTSGEDLTTTANVLSRIRDRAKSKVIQ
jgi:DNA-binding MarR family transcriptional regulator